MVKSAFAVGLGFNYPKPNKPIPFRQVIYNGQNHYKPGTGVFTCVEPGVYEFEFHCTFSNSLGYVELKRNNKRMVLSYISKQATNSRTTASGGTLVQLRRGDRVWLTVQSSSRMLSYSYFSGHLIFNP